MENIEIKLSEKDLMIGDWVMYDPNVFIEDEYVPTKECYPTIIETGEDMDSAVEGCYYPIPLTAEILEKNGFVKVENTQTSTIMYSFRDTLNRIGVFDFNHVTIDSYYTDSSCDVFISSVHELQHALRLCGINKEIEL